MPSTLPSVYLQACSVCKAECFGEKEWLNHLIEEDHQSLARKECVQKWDPKMRKKCLIIFAKVPFTKYTAGKLLNHFSCKLTTSPLEVINVTDFVWWEDRPQIGILQFESKEKVKNVLISLGSRRSKPIKIDESQRIQMKAGHELKSLEWHALLPPISNQIRSQPVTCTKEDVDDQGLGQPQKRQKLDDNAIINTTPAQPKQLINPSSILYSGRPPPSAIMTPLTHPLQFEFWSIRKAMINRDIQYQYVTSAAHSLKQILSKLDPILEVDLFRNWFLKLKYPSANNDVLLYVHSNKVSQDSNVLCKYVGKTSNREFKVLKSRKEGQFGVLYLKHVRSKVNIFLETTQSKGCLIEVQVCRLMEYMCLFDPRCYPLITLACYWVTINKINVGGEIDRQNVNELHPQYAIQWLVLFYMCHQKFIPTPEQIINRCGDEEFVKGESRQVAGINLDPKFVEEWKCEKGESLAARQQFCVGVEESSEEFIINLLKLFHRFLSFCHSALDTCHEIVLNLYNGTLIFEWTLLKNNMTLEEIKIFKEGINDTTKQQLRTRGLSMTHPILLNHSIPVSENIKSVLKLFGESNRNLSRFFTHLEKFGGESALKDVGSLENILTI